MKKLIIVSLLTLVLVLGLSAGAMAYTVASGDCGEHVTWTLDDEGLLTISGSGDMADYTGEDMPWYDFCDSITSVVIENGVTSIGDYAFADCYFLTGVTIPGSLTDIGDYAFADCYSLENVTFPEGLTSIGEAAFDSCESLTEITIPGSVESIAFCAFSCCSGLTSVTIENGVTYIDMYAFSLCESLTEITIPASVTNIGFAAFAVCTELADVYYYGIREQWDDIAIDDDNEPLTEARLHLTVIVFADYKYAGTDGETPRKLMLIGMNAIKEDKALYYGSEAMFITMDENYLALLNADDTDGKGEPEYTTAYVYIVPGDTTIYEAAAALTVANGDNTEIKRDGNVNYGTDGHGDLIDAADSGIVDDLLYMHHTYDDMRFILEADVDTSDGNMQFGTIDDVIMIINYSNGITPNP